MSFESIIWEKIRLSLGSALAGAFVLVGLGFGPGGWMFESRAEQMAEQAVIERLVPICVARFKEDPRRKEKLAGLEKVQFADQASYIARQGWATIPGAEEPNTEVASRCVREIRFVDF